MTIRAVIFDFGGVLVRSESEAGRQRLEQRYGLPPGGAARLVFDSPIAERATIGLEPYAAIWAHVAETLKLDDAQLAEYKSEFWSGDRLDTTLTQFIQNLRPRYQTAILSNAWLNARAMFTENFGLATVVDQFIISAEEGVRKPAPRIYQIACERLAVRPEEAIFVDDFDENITAARMVGLHAIHFRQREQALAELQAKLSQ